MTLSPDGRRIAFIARDEAGKQMLWVRALDALTAQPLAGTEDASCPFWSPDSRFIGFFSSGKLRKIDANGGPPQALCDAASGRGGTWGKEGTILFTPSPSEVIYKVSSAGGAATPVTAFDEKNAESTHRYPEFLPDGIHFLYLVEGGTEIEGSEDGFLLYAGSTESKERKRVLATNASARYSNTGHVLFLRDRSLLAQRFDADALATEGEAVPVAENLARTNRWETPFSVSGDGLLAYQAGAASETSQFVWMDREGRDLATVGKPADYRNVALSHDGRRVATSILDPKTQKSDVWVLDLERGSAMRLTFDPEDDTAPQWSADDRTLYFTSMRQGHGDIFRKASAGTGTDELVFADPEPNFLYGLSGDGRTGVVMTNSGRNGWDISTLDLTTGTARAFLATPFGELAPALSADGRWLAYFSNESGQNEVYVQSLLGDGGKWQISTSGGTRPRWARGDGEIVFQTLDDKLMVVDVQRTPEFRASVPRLLIDPKIRQLNGMQYAVAADGTRILVNRPVDQAVSPPVTLVQNWTVALGE
jgi:Tol biopolymer transport system component